MSAATPSSSRLAPYAGSFGALLMILSAPAHSLLGWPSLRTQLVAINTPPDLQLGLAIGWHFSGAAMVAFGLIALVTFVQGARGAAPPLTSVRIIAALYLLFGAGALTISGDPFFMVFIVPGALVGVAAARSLATGRSSGPASSARLQ